MMIAQSVQLVTLDLDDTLWAIAPLIARAEARLHDWLKENCPATAARFSIEDLRGLRRDVEQLHPELRGDISALRRQSIRLAIRRADDDESLADAAFDAFWTARNEIECFADVLPALARLKSRFTLAAVSNGNGCVHRAGLGQFFDFTLSAHEAGCAKPEAGIFRQVCQRANVQPHEALHAGDDVDCDVRGALRVGMNAVLIHRDPQTTRVLAAPAITLPDLTALADHLDC